MEDLEKIDGKCRDGWMKWKKDGHKGCKIDGACVETGNSWKMCGNWLRTSWKIAGKKQAGK